ncbi:hypothetical protein B566_EDAN009958 [Ephemera danica]|nr:hypothetical protein B566_EDAN009958 [Ephemera danica]
MCLRRHLTSSTPPRAMAALKRLLGDELLLPSSNETLVTDDFLAADETIILGFYVVSGDCPQCVEFSKRLLDFYQTREQSQANPKFKLISVSLEDDEELFKQSVQNLPWPAIHRTARHRKARLLRRLRLKAVAPTLALVESPSGRLVTAAARERLLETPDAFPWRPRPLADTLHGVTLRGSTANYADLTGVRGFYFSANWCPPCKAFTPQLAEVYHLIRERGHQFEILLVSSDRSEASFEQSMTGMPWLAVPWEAEEARRELAATFGVQGIPSLVLVDQAGHVITDEARAELGEDPDAKFFPWPARRVSRLNERTAIKLQDGAALVLLVDALREFAGLEDVVPLVTLVDVTSQRVSTLEEGSEVTTESVRRFVSAFLAGQLVWSEIAPPPPPTDQPAQCSPAPLQTHTAPSSSPAAPC